jgi:serine/threonine protein kinase
MTTVFVSWRDVTYERVESAGEGGIGKVSVALATSGPRKGILFAIKVFTPSSREKEDWKQAFMREVHVLRDCNHPAIVKVFDEGVLDNGHPFFVMEYLPENLWEAMRGGNLDERAKLSVVMQLLSALDYLCRRDPYVVHRDIKPKNIFLKGGTCVLGDFGLIFQDIEQAQVSGPGDTPGRSIPAMAQNYRTPELVAFHNGGPKPPPASDVFQPGLVAAELFTGKNPLRPGGPAKPLQLGPLGDIPGPLGEAIKARLEEMLIIDTSRRPSAFQLLPLWLDLFRTVIRRQNARRLGDSLQKESVAKTPIAQPAQQNPPKTSSTKDDFAAGIFDD